MTPTPQDRSWIGRHRVTRHYDGIRPPDIETRDGAIYSIDGIVQRRAPYEPEQREEDWSESEAMGPGPLLFAQAGCVALIIAIAVFCALVVFPSDQVGRVLDTIEASPTPSEPAHLEPFYGRPL